MSEPDYAAGQTSVQKGVIAVGGSLVTFWIFPPAGLLLGFLLGTYAAKRWLDRRSAEKARHQHEAFLRWRADPWNQQTMPGVAPTGGLSIEERNAFRNQANNIRKR